MSLQSLVRGDEAAEATKDLLAMSGAKGGVCALLECGDGKLLTELTRDGKFLVHGITRDSTTATAIRKRLASGGLSGIGSVEVLPLDRLPYADNLVNLLVAEEALTLLRNGLTPAEILRVLCPNGVACLSVTPDKRQNLESAMTNAGIRAFRFEQRSKLWLVFKKPRPAEMDDWTHSNHGPDGNPVSRDLLIQAPNQTQWLAGPSWRTSRRNVGPAAAQPYGMLSANGRNYYFQGGGLVARDAFNGVLLWSQTLLPRYRTRQMVAAGDEVYLCREDGLVALDGATGQLLRTYAGEAKVSQLLLDRGTLFAVDGRGIRAFDDDKGTERWKWDRRPSGVVADAGRLYFLAGRGQLVCLSQKDGSEIWKRDVSADAGEKASLSFATHGIILLKSGTKEGTRFTILSNTDGSKVWAFSSNKAKALAYLAAGLLWIETDSKTPAEGHPAIRIQSEIISKWMGHDPKTGTLRRTVVAPATVKYRCHPLYATDRFAIGNRPIYFVDWQSGEVSCFEGTRAQCGSAYSLAQGMFYGLYTDSKKCMCMSTVISGVTAFASDGKTFTGEVPLQKSGRLIRGTATAPSSPTDVTADDWPMYRRDHQRTGCATVEIPSKLKVAWQQKLLPPARGDAFLKSDWLLNKPSGDVITSPTIANGKVFVGLTHAHRIVALDEDTGRTVWSYHTPARVDAPPTIYQGLCLWGCHDGWVYCVIAESGELVWRFRAGPAERRMVAYGQVESAWPVVGGVLLVRGTAYVIAGRTTETDGGLYVHALRPRTGELLWTRRLAKKENVIFGGYTPRRGTTYVGAADLLCSDGKTISVAGCARGRFNRQTGKALGYTRGGPAFGWTPTRYYTDQYGTRSVPVAFLGGTAIVRDGRSSSIRSTINGGWRAAVPRTMMVEALAAASGAGNGGSKSSKGSLTEEVWRPVSRVPALEQPPEIDGRIDALYTELASPLRYSFLDGAKRSPRELTTCYAVSDRENLYLAFRCEKPNPEKAVSRKTKRDDNIWQDECVEIFIDTQDSRKGPYFQIVINPAGVVQDSYNKDNTWNGALDVRCGREEGKAWIAEIRIPFSELSAKSGKLGQAWAVNFNRSARNPDNPQIYEDTAWSPTFSASSHVPEMYGYLWLDALAKDHGKDSYADWQKSLRPVVRDLPTPLPGIGSDTASVFAAISHNHPDRPGGELWVLSASDGEKLATYQLPAAPAYDGLAIAGKKAYVSLQDGSVVCLEGE